MREEIRKINLRSKGYEKLLSDLNLYIDDLMNRNESLKHQLDNFNSENEIKKLKDEINHLKINSIHIMTEKEENDARSFSEKHYDSCKSSIDYILTGTGIGTATRVQCKKCKEIKIITDHDNW